MSFLSSATISTKSCRRLEEAATAAGEHVPASTAWLAAWHCDTLADLFPPPPICRLPLLHLPPPHQVPLRAAPPRLHHPLDCQTYPCLPHRALVHGGDPTCPALPPRPPLPSSAASPSSDLVSTSRALQGPSDRLPRFPRTCIPTHRPVPTQSVDKTAQGGRSPDGSQDSLRLPSADVTPGLLRFLLSR